MAFRAIHRDWPGQCPALLLGLVLLLSATAGAAEGSPQSSWFETRNLNAGLGMPPEGLDISTPREAVIEFLDSSDAGDYARAAHVLDLSSLSEQAQTDRGPELARKLREVMNRTMVIDWNQLPARYEASNRYRYRCAFN